LRAPSNRELRRSAREWSEILHKSGKSYKIKIREKQSGKPNSKRCGQTKREKHGEWASTPADLLDQLKRDNAMQK